MAENVRAVMSRDKLEEILTRLSLNTTRVRTVCSMGALWSFGSPTRAGAIGPTT